MLPAHAPRAFSALLACHFTSYGLHRGRAQQAVARLCTALDNRQAGSMPHSSSSDDQMEQIVRCIHHSPWRTAVYVTGGASQGVAWLLAVPGASSTVLEVQVPYSRHSLMELLAQVPAQYCSPETALQLAKAAYQRAAVLSSFGVPIIGLAATCSLASEPPKRGEHRACVATYNSGGSHLLTLKLAKGLRSRAEEEELVGKVLLQVLAQACGVDVSGLSLPLMSQLAAQQQQHGSKQPGNEVTHSSGQDSITSNASNQQSSCPSRQQPTSTAAGQVDELCTQSISQPEPLQELLAGRIRCVEFSGGNVYVNAPRGPGRVYLPGSFNPLHEGHRQMLQAAVKIAGPEAEGCFELSLMNADKGKLAIEEVQCRVAQFVTAGLPVLITAAPLLVDKARLLPGATFVLGWDTAVRIVMPKYYGDSYTAMLLVFGEIRCQKCRFLVAGRVDDKGDGSFKQLTDIEVAPEMADLFEPIPEAIFRSNISSTALRAAGKGLGKL